MFFCKTLQKKSSQISKIDALGKLLCAFVLVLGVFVLLSCGTGGGGSAAVTAPSEVVSPSTDDPVNNLWRFKTSCAQNISAYGENYKGTAVYYKIYTDQSTALQDAAAITALEANPKSAFDKMTSLNFALLNGVDVLVPKKTTDQNVEVRLCNESSYTADIKIDSNSIGAPKRASVSNGFAFTNIYSPKSTDSDFKGTESANGPWYVVGFACASVVDESTLALSVSPKYLGILKISL